MKWLQLAHRLLAVFIDWYKDNQPNQDAQNVRTSSDDGQPL